jgi:hypothetical protein
VSTQNLVLCASRFILTAAVWIFRADAVRCDCSCCTFTDVNPCTPSPVGHFEVPNCSKCTQSDCEGNFPSTCTNPNGGSVAAASCAQNTNRPGLAPPISSGATGCAAATTRDACKAAADFQCCLWCGDSDFAGTCKPVDSCGSFTCNTFGFGCYCNTGGIGAGGILGIIIAVVVVLGVGAVLVVGYRRSHAGLPFLFWQNPVYTNLK